MACPRSWLHQQVKRLGTGPLADLKLSATLTLWLLPVAINAPISELPEDLGDALLMHLQDAGIGFAMAHSKAAEQAPLHVQLPPLGPMDLADTLMRLPRVLETFAQSVYCQCFSLPEVAHPRAGALEVTAQSAAATELAQAAQSLARCASALCGLWCPSVAAYQALAPEAITSTGSGAFKWHWGSLAASPYHSLAAFLSVLQAGAQASENEPQRPQAAPTSLAGALQAATALAAQIEPVAKPLLEAYLQRLKQSLTD
jgi:hypothetical protein